MNNTMTHEDWQNYLKFLEDNQEFYKQKIIDLNEDRKRFNTKCMLLCASGMAICLIAIVLLCLIK